MFKGLRIAVAGFGVLAATAMPAFSQGTLRIGMTAADIPLTTDRRRIQTVVATPTVCSHDSNSSSASAGVFHPKDFLGRALRAIATAAISSAL